MGFRRSRRSLLTTFIRKISDKDPEHLVRYSEEQNVSTDLIGVNAAIVIEGQFNHSRTAFMSIDLSQVPNIPLRIEIGDGQTARGTREDIRLVRQ